MRMIEKVKEWLNARNNQLPSGTHYFKTLDDSEGQPCLRTYAVHSLKGKAYKIKEVVREYLSGEIYVHGDLYFCGAAGYKVNWGNRKYYGYYMPVEMDDNWYQVDLKTAPGMTCDELFRDSDVNQIFGKYIPYFVYESEMNVMQFARNYRDYPSAEQLVKAGFGYLAMDKRVLKLSKQGKKKLVQWLFIKENGDYLKRIRVPYNKVSQAVKRNITITRYFYEETINEYAKSFKNAEFERTFEECEEVYRYLNHPKKVQRIGLHDYIDYLRVAREMNYDMTAKETLFPRNAAAAHDHLIKTKKALESQIINNKLKQIAEILNGKEISKGDLKLVIPTCQKDFVKWGDKLHICVGRYGYDEKMAKGDCIILMVYLNDQPLECCELTKKEKGHNLKIEQLRGEHNGRSERHDDCEKLVNQFIKTYKNQHLIGACV